MKIEAFNLQTARISKPQPSQLAGAQGSAYCQVLACPTPARIRLDSAVGTAVPAVPGLVLRNFRNLYIENAEGMGNLVLGFSDCAPGSPESMSGHSSIVLLSDNADAAVGINATIAAPSNEYGIAITAVQFSTTDPADVSFGSLQWEAGGTIQNVLRGSMVGGNFALSFPSPVIPKITSGPRVHELNVETSADGAAASTHFVEVYGYFFRFEP